MLSLKSWGDGGGVVTDAHGRCVRLDGGPASCVAVAGLLQCRPAGGGGGFQGACNLVQEGMYAAATVVCTVLVHSQPVGTNQQVNVHLPPCAQPAACP